MVKLTKEEIQFIDNYLIKNEVKYWDVRLELLDHIIASVEDKMNSNGLLFNDALLEVHQDFGNNLKIYGIYNQKLMKSGLYADKKGFEKFTIIKQKELGRKYRKRFWEALKSLFTNFNFLVEYLVVIFVFISIFQYSQLLSIILGLAVLMLPYFYSLYHSFNDKSTRKSLSITMISNSGFLLFSLYNVGLQTFNLFYKKGEYKPYFIFIIAIFIAYPIIKAQMKVYFKVYKEHKNTYNLKLS